MAMVYYADPVTLISMGARPEPDGYQLKSNENFDNPSGLQSPQKLTPTGWVAATDEEHKAYLEAQQKKFLAENPQLDQPSQPVDDKGTEALGALGKQVGQLVIDNQKNTQAVQALGAQIAGLIAKDTTNGGK
jgi:hypothetical protein